MAQVHDAQSIKANEVRDSSKLRIAVHHIHRYMLPALVCVMHIVVLIYLSIWIIVLFYARAGDIKATNMYNPKVTVAAYMLFILLHSIAILRLFLWRVKRSYLVYPEWLLLHTSWNSQMDQFLIAFNLFEIGCQSYQAYQMFAVSVVTRKAVIYSSVVVVYCFASPFLLFIRNANTKMEMVHLADALFSFILSCGFPLLAVLIAILGYLVHNRNLAEDNLWVVQTLALARLLVPSSLSDFATKMGMHLGTYIALHRTTSFLQICTSAPSDGTTTSSSSRKKFILRVNLLVTLLWGCFLTSAIIWSLVDRTPCPSYCLAESKPLFVRSCTCMYAVINCYSLQVPDPMPLLSPETIGSELIVVQVSRCSVPNGIPSQVLAPFTKLSKIMILFSNMTSWEGPLPPNIYYVMIRFSKLESIPQAIQHGVNDLVVLLMEGCNLKSISDEVFIAWRSVHHLSLVDVGLTGIPRGVATMLSLQDLNLRLNDLSQVSLDDLKQLEALNQLTWIRLSWTNLSHIPWALATNAVVDMSGNPLSTVLTESQINLIQKRRVIVDGTSYCNSGFGMSCQQICASGCLVAWVADLYCDVTCYVATCDYDQGDCDAFGFTTSNLNLKN